MPKPLSLAFIGSVAVGRHESRICLGKKEWGRKRVNETLHLVRKGKFY